MRRPAARALTLVELMVVMAIVAILVAIAVPGVRQIWQTVGTTQCQHNLSVIFQAQTAWRADSSGQILCGKGWAGKLMPYVERQEGIFRCPLAPEVAMTLPQAAGASDSGAQAPGSERLEAAFEFQVYTMQGGDASASAQRGELAYTIPLDAYRWVRRTQQGSGILYEVDDEGPAAGGDKESVCDDIRFLITYQGGRPANLQILQQACKASPYKKFAYDFLVNGEVLVSNWVTHIGESYDLGRSEAGGAASGGDTQANAARNASGGPMVRYLVVPADYGLSKGAYAMPGAIRGSLDPRLAMVLDYPKALAEFNGEGGDEWKWDKYFIEAPGRWKQAWGATGEDWTVYQSLRHAGRANVLYCDGHIEALGPEDLRPSRSLWAGQGR